MERETMRSITTWLLLASVHQAPVPSHVTAAGSCAQVTRPGTTPRGTPTGESVGSNKEEPILLAAAIERANCRRVISILATPPSMNHCSVCASEKWGTHAHGSAPPSPEKQLGSNVIGTMDSVSRIHQPLPFGACDSQMIRSESRRIFRLVLDIMLESPKRG